MRRYYPHTSILVPLILPEATSQLVEDFLPKQPAGALSPNVWALLSLEVAFVNAARTVGAQASGITARQEADSRVARRWVGPALTAELRKRVGSW